LLLMRCGVVCSCTRILAFRRNLLPPSARWRTEKGSRQMKLVVVVKVKKKSKAIPVTGLGGL
jgi:hypothetical protein